MLLDCSQDLLPFRMPGRVKANAVQGIFVGLTRQRAIRKAARSHRLTPRRAVLFCRLPAQKAIRHRALKLKSNLDYSAQARLLP